MNIPQNLPVAVPLWGAGGTGDDNWKAAAAKQTFRMNYCAEIPDDLIALQCRYDRMLPLLAELPTAMLPTVIYLAEKGATDYDTATPVNAADVTDLIEFSAYEYEGTQFIEYPGQIDINQAASITAVTNAGPVTTTWGAWVKDGGFYYLILEFPDTTRLYSELLKIVDFPETSEVPDNECLSRVRIECVNNCPIGPVPPVSLAAQKVFTYFVLTEPSYLYEKSPSVNGKKQERIDWALVKKRWKLTIFGTETLADFCSLLPLYSANEAAVYISDQWGVGSSVQDVEVEVSWPDELKGCLAKIDIYFTRDYIDSENCCQ